jgi:hypothetical protein
MISETEMDTSQQGVIAAELVDDGENPELKLLPTPPGAPPRDEKGRLLPGQSLNPGGRYRDKPFTDAYKRLLSLSIEEFTAYTPKTMFEVRAYEMISAQGKNLVPACREMADRVEGKAADPDSAASGGNTTQVIVLNAWKTPAPLPASEHPKLLPDLD